MLRRWAALMFRRGQDAGFQHPKTCQHLWFVSAKGVQVSLLSMGLPPTIEVANLGMADSLILMVMALVVFGPRKLPQIGRQIGKLMYEFRKASNDFKFQMEEELRSAEDADRRKQDEERQRAQALAAPPSPTPAIETPNAIESSVVSADPSLDQVLDQSAAVPEETQPEETYPRIQPPSTGEPVPGARPWSPPAEVKVTLSAEPESAADSTASTSVVPDEADPAAAEQEAHHG